MWMQFSFDDIPVEHKQCCVKKINTLSVVDLDEEEQEHDQVADNCENIEDKESKIKLKS